LRVALTYPWIVPGTAMVNHYYLYCVDEDFGPFFIKFCSYFPYGGRLCLNGAMSGLRTLRQTKWFCREIVADLRYGRKKVSGNCAGSVLPNSAGAVATCPGGGRMLGPHWVLPLPEGRLARLPRLRCRLLLFASTLIYGAAAPWHRTTPGRCGRRSKFAEGRSSLGGAAWACSPLGAADVRSCHWVTRHCASCRGLAVRDRRGC
jgi:hypothetical protein